MSRQGEALKEKEGTQGQAVNREGRDKCLGQDWQLTGKEGDGCLGPDRQ